MLLDTDQVQEKNLKENVFETYQSCREHSGGQGNYKDERGEGF